MMFTVQDAKALMLRNEESRLRIIGITPVVYTVGLYRFHILFFTDP